MDIRKMIRELQAEREALERAISSLEQLQNSETGIVLPESRSRRGRKSMGAEEREEVSARMKKYWAQRRSAMRVGTSAGL
jgi:hypothetical protein